MNDQRNREKDSIKRTIEQHVFVTSDDDQIILKKRNNAEGQWLFDFRRVLMFGDIIRDLTILFNKDFPIDPYLDERPSIQLCGLEAAAISIVTGIVVNRYNEGEKKANGFFVRKARKKDGLLKHIEGTILDDVPIVLVDDVISSGSSFIRQVEVLERAGKKVHAVWCVLRYRDTAFYEYFAQRNIPIYSVFTLDDFSPTLGVHNVVPKDVAPTIAPWKSVWHVAAKHPSYAYVMPKSTLCIDNERVYMGTDAGACIALNQLDGSVVWEMQIGTHPRGKGIFSSPMVYAGNVFFGGYDGNVYALDALTGKKRWVNFEADWIGSSPCVAPDLGLLFIGLEFGLIRKRGGIAAIDIATGKTVWAYRSMKAFTHASPIYIKKTKEVVIGSNDGVVYLFDAGTGTPRWTHKTGDPSHEELLSGFSACDIKDACVYHEGTDTIVGGNLDGTLFCIKRATGVRAWTFTGEYGFWSRPTIHKDRIYVSCIDRHVYCIDVRTGALVWKKNLGARAFCQPVIIDGHVLVGANTGKLSKLDMHTGTEIGYITLTERITNPPSQNPVTKRIFASTYANEIYCLEEKHASGI